MASRLKTILGLPAATPAMHHGRCELVYLLGDTPYGERYDWFLDQVLELYQECRLHPRGVTVREFDYPYPDYPGIS